MLRVITMTAYRRPAYTREVLAALAQCDGIGDWLLLPNVEPGHEEVIAVFRQWSACESRLAVNKERMGLNRNTQEALVRALLLRANVVVHLEEGCPNGKVGGVRVEHIRLLGVRSSQHRSLHQLGAEGFEERLLRFRPAPN